MNKPLFPKKEIPLENVVLEKVLPSLKNGDHLRIKIDASGVKVQLSLPERPQ